MIKKIQFILTIFLIFFIFIKEIKSEHKNNIIQYCQRDYLFEQISTHFKNNDQKLSEISAFDCLQIAGYYDNKYLMFLINTLPFKKNKDFFITTLLINNPTEINIQNLKYLLEVKKSDVAYLNWVFDILLKNGSNHYIKIFDDFNNTFHPKISEHIARIRKNLDYKPYNTTFESVSDKKKHKSLKDEEINKILIEECKNRILINKDIKSDPEKPIISFNFSLECLFLGDKEKSYELFKELIESNLDTDYQLELINVISRYRKKDDFTYFKKLFHEKSEKELKKKLIYSMDGYDDEQYLNFLTDLKKSNILEMNELEYLIEKVKNRILFKNINSFEEVLNINPDIVITEDPSENLLNLIKLNEKYHQDILTLGYKYLLKKYPDNDYLNSYIASEIMDFNEIAIKTHMEKIKNDSYLTSLYLVKRGEIELKNFNYNNSLENYTKILENKIPAIIETNSIYLLIEKLKFMIKFNGV